MAFILWTATVSLCLVLTTIMKSSIAEARSSSPYIVETNEITAYDFDERAISSPICGENAVCGYLQTNARGINKQRLCACTGNTKCPMVWDEEDGYSITQGPDQYKFCGRVGNLPQCETGYTAYKTRIYFSKATMEKVKQTDQVVCFCPKTHTYELANHRFGDLDAETEIVDATYVCAPLPTCRAGDICKMVSEAPESFLVSRKCQCPTGLRCPTVVTNTAESITTGKGMVHPIRCQH